MRELAIELKQLRMHGMDGAWTDLVEQDGGGAGQAALARWLLEHLLQARRTLPRPLAWTASHGMDGESASTQRSIWSTH